MEKVNKEGVIGPDAKAANWIKETVASLEPETELTVEEFFEKAFNMTPESDPGYFKEWQERWQKGPRDFMDESRQALFDELKKQKKLMKEKIAEVVTPVEVIKEAKGNVIDLMEETFAPNLPLKGPYEVDRKEIKRRMMDEQKIDVTDAMIDELIERVGAVKVASTDLQNQIAQEQFGKDYNGLDEEQKSKVNYTVDNMTGKEPGSKKADDKAQAKAQELFKKDLAALSKDELAAVEKALIEKKADTKELPSTGTNLEFGQFVAGELADTIDLSDAKSVCEFFYDGDYAQMIEDNSFINENAYQDIVDNTDSFRDKILENADMDEEAFEEYMLENKIEDEDEALQQLFEETAPRMEGSKLFHAFFGGNYRGDDEEYVDTYAFGSGKRSRGLSDYFSSKDLKHQVTGKYADEDMIERIIEGADMSDLVSVIEDNWAAFPIEDVLDFIDANGVDIKNIEDPELLKVLKEREAKEKAEELKKQELQKIEEVKRKKEEAEKYFEGLPEEVKQHLKEKLK